MGCLSYTKEEVVVLGIFLGKETSHGVCGPHLVYQVHSVGDYIYEYSENVVYHRILR